MPRIYMPRGTTTSRLYTRDYTAQLVVRALLDGDRVTTEVDEKGTKHTVVWVGYTTERRYLIYP